jgi:hypothetical protein
MSSPGTTGGYGLGPGEGEALWFNGGMGVLKATADQTEGRFAAMELVAPKGFASPLHIHAPYPPKGGRILCRPLRRGSSPAR